jgi:hypothetical protein
LRDAVGINLNDVSPEEADATAELLSQSGFARARVEFGWDVMDPARPTRIGAGGVERIRAMVGALRDHGIRPLVLLNANHNAPGPTRRFEARIVERADEGARSIRVDAATARRIVPGRTGLDQLDGGAKAAEVLFTAVDAGGTVTLARPLPEAVPRGRKPATTLTFAPFGPPQAEDAAWRASFERTMDGWLAYAEAVTRAVAAVYGSDDFDVEVWNELGFGSDHLYADRYYDPAPKGSGDITAVLLERTVERLRRPASPVRGVRISDGFASQRPWDSGATSPRGLAALSKHPYYGMRRFPAQAVYDGQRPLDARGRVDARRRKGRDGGTVYRDRFVPRYDSFFPEYILNGIQTETLVRDIAPRTTDIQGQPHGRDVPTQGGGDPPAVWITEVNMDPVGAEPKDASGKAL